MSPTVQAKLTTFTCAIYVRKSTDEHMNAEFTSLDSQREYCQAFIKSREGEGWRAYAEDYVDSGYTGGNMDRPGLKKLIADAKQGKFQVVVCYKYDRLSRNTRDFLHVLDIFEKQGVAFVSVTQPIDTTSSVGRLMRSILMDFAQFEREMISERTKDKMAAIVRKGRRAGGFPILGYDINWETKHLVVNEEEAKAILDIFKTYVRTQSLSRTAKNANEKGYRGKLWTTRDSKRRRGGGPFNKTTLLYHLRNPVYIGKVRHYDKLYPGVHKPIVPDDLFEQVGQLLTRNQDGKVNRVGRKQPHHFFLKGLVRCVHCGSIMSPTYNGQGITYYKCHRVIKLDKTACPAKAANAPGLEQAIVARLSQLSQDPAVMERIVSRARHVSSEELPTKRQERAAAAGQLSRIESQVKNLVHVLSMEGAQSAQYRAIMDGMGQAEAERGRLQTLVEAMDRQIQKLEGERIEADVIRNNLARFGSLFGKLQPEEQREFLRLLISEIAYDSIKGKMEIKLRPLPGLSFCLDHGGDVSNSVQIGCPYPTLGKHKRELKNSFVLWHNAKFGIVLAAKGRQEIVDYPAFQARLAVLAKRARKPKPPRIQAVLKEAHELKARLAADRGLTRESLAGEKGLNPGQLTRLLRLADLAPEIQHHILALPPSIHRGAVTERRLRPIAAIPDHKEQVERFRDLLSLPVRARKPCLPAVQSQPAYHLGA
ncbi:MAG: recombinase family protein [Elusimicrobiota bacterium]